MQSRWTRIETALRAGAPAVSAEHPTPEVLARFASAGSSLTEADAAAIDRHLQACVNCRSDVAALRGFDFAAGARLADEATRVAAEANRALGDSPRAEGVGKLATVIELFTSPRWAIPLAAAAVALLAFMLSESGPGRNEGAPGAESVGGEPSLVGVDGDRGESLAADRESDPHGQVESEGLETTTHEKDVLVAEKSASEPANPIESERSADDEPGVGQASESTLAKSDDADDVGSTNAPNEELAANAGEPGSKVGSDREEPGASAQESGGPEEALREESLLASLSTLGDPNYSVPSAADGYPFDAPDRSIVLRSVQAADVRVVALAPSHVGRTVSRSPELWFYLSADTDQPIRLQVVDESSIDPVLEHRIAGGMKAGFHALDLRELGVDLAVGKLYEWSIMVEVDPQRPIVNPRAFGSIVRIEGDPTASAARPSSDVGRGHALARAGIWYDAVAEIAGRAARNPEDRMLTEQRSSLLRSAGIRLNGGAGS